MSGKALTVSELAEESGVTIQTASSHLAKLDEGGLLRPRKQGRHKYFALANDEVAHVLEALIGLAVGSGHLRKRTGPRDAALRQARVCYNHLAGDMGTRMFDSLRLTDAGADLAAELRVDLVALRGKRPPLCRECLDWSERRSHLAGSLGRVFMSRFEELRRVKRDQKTRIVTFSKTGAEAFERLFSLG